jgi:2-methylcitrate dehydratase
MSTESQRLAAFVARASYDDLSESARAQLKIRVLDALGCALGARDGMPVRALRDQIGEFDGRGGCSLVGGGCAAPDRAAFYNGALVRYLDFNDSYLAKGETCHPSDNLGAVLAASESADRSGRDLMAALAVAYQVQCRLSDEAPVRSKGFDHTTQGAYAVAAGVASALGLTAAQTAHAIGMCGSAFNALRVTRTGALSHWKGLAYPNMAAGCTFAVLLAQRGITGPAEVFEGNKGFKDAIAGDFEIDWQREDLERVTRTILKKYNAEIHAQSAIDAVLALHARADEVEHVDLEIFDVAYHIIGGGEEGDKTGVRTKEEADHSLPYMLAAAIIDGQLMPAQYLPERIVRDDVQALLRKVAVRPNARYSERFPDEHACQVTITVKSGRTLEAERRDYEGFHTRPMRWDAAVRKFTALAGERPPIADAVANLEHLRVRELTRLLT